MTRLAIFDLDGTLLDSMPLLTKLAVHVLRPYCPGSAQDAYLKTVGRPFAEQVDIIMQNSIHSSQEVKRTVISRYEELHRITAPYMPMARGMRQMMWLAQSRSVKLALISSTSETIIASLQQFPHKMFHGIYGFRQDLPKALQMDLAIKDLGEKDAHVCYFGDTDYDAQIAAERDVKFRRVTCDTVHREFIAEFGGASVPQLQEGNMI